MIPAASIPRFNPLIAFTRFLLAVVEGGGGELYVEFLGTGPAACTAGVGGTIDGTFAVGVPVAPDILAYRLLKL